MEDRVTRMNDAVLNMAYLFYQGEDGGLGTVVEN